MSTADSQSQVDVTFGPRTTSRNNQGIWLNGDVLTCACPECGAPMSIRLWLMVADCWRCGTSIELTEEQERVARQLLEEREASLSQERPVPQQSAENLKAPPATRPAPQPEQKPAEKPEPVSKQVVEKQPEKKPVQASEPAQQEPAQQEPVAKQAVKPAPNEAPAPRRQVAVTPGPVRQPAAQSHHRVRQRMQEAEDEGETFLWFREMFGDMTSWLASAVLHMALLILLGSIFMIDPPEVERPLVLSTRISDDSKADDGATDDAVKVEEPDTEPEKVVEPEPEPEPEPEVVEEKKPDPEPDPEPDVPKGEPFGDDVVAIAETLGIKDFANIPVIRTGPGGASMIAGRKTPQSRKDLVAKGGGTIRTEAAVARGLKWLARHQNPDGSWGLHNFHLTEECKGRCTGQGTHSDTAATGLALLPFLGAGQTHLTGDYRREVERGLYWLVHYQRADGDLRSGSGRMYSHAQAAIALCEAFALTRDKKLEGPAQLAIDFIVDAQHGQGGWRYNPGQAGDTSVVGWQVMALKSAQMAYLKVPPETLEKVHNYLDSAQCDSAGGQYAYQRGNPTPTMSAEALLCRQYLGWPQNHPGLVDGTRRLVQRDLPNRRQINMYYWYYATQVMHHMGGEVWEEWNPRMSDLLCDMQIDRGHATGSWDPGPGHDRSGGRVYMTALAVCTLEVYYRHMPLYSSQATSAPLEVPSFKPPASSTRRGRR